jgi:hypothetical protein
VRIIKELTSRLSSLGIDLVTEHFIISTMAICAKHLGQAYSGLEIPDIVECVGARQILADAMFLEMVLRSPAEFTGFKEVMEKKVWYLHGFG